MEYRVLGRTGMKMSIVSVGGWLTFGTLVDRETTGAVIREALDNGINHFDSADCYQVGRCDEAMAYGLEGVPRSDVVLSSKVFWPTGDGPNDRGLSRKHIIESCEATLRRFKTDYLDLFYCHRFDPDVELDETLCAMEDLIERGKVLYWGVSCWKSGQIREACRRVRRYKPVVDQPPYNVFDRTIEKEVLPACREEGLGVVCFSPLAQGVLTGKYLEDPAPKGSRASDSSVNGFMQKYLTPEAAGTVRRLLALAKECGRTPAQLALGWCLRRPELTSVIVGATRPEQIRQNARTRPLEPDVLARVEEIVADAPRYPHPQGG